MNQAHLHANAIRTRVFHVMKVKSKLNLATDGLKVRLSQKKLK